MKFILITGFYLISFCSSIAQNSKKNSPLPEINPKIISLQMPVAKEQPVSKIADIQVIDARPDSTCLGLYKNSADKYHSLVLKTNVANEVGNFMSEYLSIKDNANDNGVHIRMVIRKLWLTNELRQDTNAKAATNPGGSWLSGVIARIEFYYSSGNGYSPFYRFDTMYARDGNILNNTDYVPDVLVMSARKLLTVDLNNIRPAKVKMSLSEIDAYNTKAFNIPIIHTAVYNKGVYKTFEEFKTNSPSITSFEIEGDKLSKTVFVKNTAGEYGALRDAWGYCDGTHLYIQSADSYFEMVPQQNTFICSAAKAISRYRNVKAENILMLGLFGGGVGKQNKKVTYGLNLKPFELDIDTGELF